MNRIRAVSMLTLVIAVLAVHSFGQPKGGRSSPPAPAPPPPTVKPKPDRPQSKSRPMPRPPRTKAPIAKFGTLSISASEPGSEIFVTQNGENVLDGDSVHSPEDGSPVVVTDLPAGKYTLLVRKAGYYEYERTVTVIGGRREAVFAGLRPTAAFLTVLVPGVRDATIDLGDGSTFTGEVRRHLVAPGRYTIRVSRKGYIPQTKVVDVTMLGLEYPQTIILQPVPIDSLLAAAEQKLQAQDYAAAELAANEALQFEPEHPRVNLIYGLSLFFRGSDGSCDYLLNAVRGGQRVSLPVRALAKIDGGLGLFEGNLTMDKNYLSFSFAARPDLSISIFKPDLDQLVKSVDRANVPNIELKANGESRGRRVERKLTLYSTETVVRANRKETFCSPTARRPCNADIDTLHRLISDWQYKFR